MTVEKHWTDLKFTKDAYNRQDERELFEALEIGLRTAAASCRAIAHARGQGRWSQMALLLENIREKCDALKERRDLGVLNLAPPAFDVKVN
jgi:hypothetical protein